MKRQIIAALLALTGIAVASVWWFGRTPRWNIVLVTLDTTRADHLGCYGSLAARTPNLDQLAGESTLFERAYTVVPITLPAHATVLTGLLPPEHGLRINGVSRLPESVPTLAETLSEQGYRTAAFVSSLVLDARFGLNRGFDVYDDSFETAIDGPRPERTAEETISSALTWLNDAAGEPLFCWVHLYDPHEPYDAHSDEFGAEFVEQPYRGEIAYMDRQIGRLLDFVPKSGFGDRTIIIVVGDHGEGLGEHQESTHGYLTYNSTLHVPLMIRNPDWTGGARITVPVSLADLHPTILDVLQLDLPPSRAGRSLVPFAQGPPPAAQPCYAESEAPYMEGGWSPVRAWITDRWKYIDTAVPELYDLQVDPGEMVNVISSNPDEVALLAQDLMDFEAALSLQLGETVASSDEQLQALRGLGYAGGQVPADTARSSLRDIKDMLPFAEQVHHCMHLIDHREAAQAQQILETVVAAAPDYAKAWGTLGVCLAVQGRFAAAEENYRKALELDSNQNFARIGLGRALYETGRLEECVEQLEAAVTFETTALDAQYYLGEACLQLGRWDCARTALNEAISLQPEFSESYRALADVERLNGRLQPAAELYERALALNPESSTAAVKYARVLFELGRDGQAIQTLQTLLQKTPGNIDAMCDLAVLQATTRNPAFHNSLSAVAMAETACRLSNRRSIAALRALGTAYAAAGRYEQAAGAAAEALEIARSSEGDTSASEIEDELMRYRNQANHPDDARQ